MGAGPIEVSVSDAFQHYFATTQIGGMFALTADFPVAGDVSLIGGVKVSFTNRLGPSEAKRFPAP